MTRRQSFSVGLSLAFAALGLCISPLAMATHSSTTTTSSGTSTCKLCTHIQWQIEAGDLNVEFDNLPNWNGTILYTNRPGRTITGKVCTDANQTECATAEFHIPDGQSVRCTGFALKSCEKSGRRDSLKTFTQQCGAPTTDEEATSPLADCVGRLEAVTNGATITSSPAGLLSIADGYGVNLGGAAQAALNNDCTAVFKNAPGEFSTKEMGRIQQLHQNSTNCNADPTTNVVDVTQNQRACSSLSSTDESAVPTCYRGEDDVPVAAIAITQNFIPYAKADCLPDTLQQTCSTIKDQGKYRIIVTGAELIKLGVSLNDVDASKFKCGDPVTGIVPESVTPTNFDGDTLLDFDVRCLSCHPATGVFMCINGECWVTGTDGAQPFAGRCEVNLN